MPKGQEGSGSGYKWYAKGDVNAFFGLMLDNMANLILTVGLLYQNFGFPTKFAIRHMIPGTAIGVLVGDLMFFWLSFQLFKRTGHKSITAMPLGLDTPSTFGMIFFVLGPAFENATKMGLDENAAAMHTWHLGIAAIFVSGLFKIVCAFSSNLIRRTVPRAGLLGSLTAIALVLISFMPLVDMMHQPVIGLIALAIILTTLVARIPFPFKVPGALASLLVAGSMFYVMKYVAFAGAGEISSETGFDPQQGIGPYEWLSAVSFSWVPVLFTEEFLNYLPIIIPFALCTVVGGIDCTESAAAAGDEYDTGQVVGIEAVATIIAACCGGVIQSTPYIGHPAYKAMGARSAYVLATALFVGAAGVIGFFGYMYEVIPKPTVLPMLIFVGLEITAQSFYATPKKHYTAVALACMPALAYLLIIHLDKVGWAIDWSRMKPEDAAARQQEFLVIRMLANGFIVTSVIWAAWLAGLIDRKVFAAAIAFGLAAVFTLFGIMHSPLPGSSMFLPWTLPAEREKELNLVLQFAGGYMFVAAMTLAWGFWLRTKPEELVPPKDLEH